MGIECRVIANLVWLSCIAILWISGGASPKAQDRTNDFKNRVALIIGSADYRELPKLANPVTEARAVDNVLRSLGFSTTVVANGSRADITRAISEFSDHLRQQPQSVAIFYYTGSGIEIDGKNYLLPVDFRGRAVTDVALEAIELSELTSRISNSNRNGFNFFTFDACRDNPFARTLSRSVSRGLAPIVVPSADSVILFSTQPGTTASDGEAGGLGPFATAFIKHIATPDLDFSRFLSRMQAEVLDLTRGSQRPTIVGLPPEIYLVPSDKVLAAPSLGAELFRPKAEPPKKQAVVTVDQLSAGEIKLGQVFLTVEKQTIPVYEGSYALLIGISNYDADKKAWKSLPGVRADIEAIKTALIHRHGFEVTTVIDPDDVEMEAQIKNFIAVHGAKENARLLIYYAGHGYTTSIASNPDPASPKLGWLIPRNTPHPDDAPAKFRVTAMSMQRIVEFSAIIQSKHVLWIFDSCFSGAAFDMSASRARDEGTLPKHLRDNIRQIITSGSADEEVPDQSEFARVFVDALNGSVRVGRENTYFTGVELGEYLQQMVRRYRNETQNPQTGVVRIRGLDSGRFVFKIEK